MRDFFQDPASFLQRVLLSLSVHVDIPPGSIPALAAVAVGLLVPLLLFWLRNRSTHKSGGAGEDDGKSDISRGELSIKLIIVIDFLTHVQYFLG